LLPLPAIRALALAASIALVACNRSPDRATPTAQASGSGPAATPASANPAARSLEKDDRVAYLLEPCARNEPFLENTSDLIPVLVSKLAAGALEPLRGARAELADIGDAALPEMRRLFDRSYGDAFLGQRLQNVIEVIGLMKSDAGRDVLLRGLAHPQEIVRQSAARALVNHPSPDDYDKLEAVLGFSSSDTQTDIVFAMQASDRARLARQFSDWLEKGEHPILVRVLAPRLCDTTDAAILARWRAVYEKLEGEVRVFVQAAVAKIPDEVALSELRGWSKDKNPTRRQVTARALAKVGLEHELAGMLKSDPEDSLRAEAANAIAAAGDGPETRAFLTAALSDPALQVRGSALQALVSRGDSAARDLALTLLRGGREELDTAMRVLREPMSRDRELAEKAYAILVALHTGETQPVLVDARLLERSIGQIPLEKSAHFLMTQAEVAQADIQGLDAHRWYAQQAGNAGPEARAWLRAQWASEADPKRRMDLVSAGTVERSPETRRFLLEVLDSDRSTPVEILYAADRLVRLGPSTEVAPTLKRVTLRMTDPKVRPALNCMLWTWYGASK
jgi:HEAT repeat protein